MVIKILLYTAIGIALIFLSLYIWDLFYSDKIVETDYLFEGVIEEISFYSGRDGSDVMIVSGKNIIVFPGMALGRGEPKGTIFDSGGSALNAGFISRNKDDLIGERVEVFCKKRFFSRDKKEAFMLIGNESYYIKLLDYVKSD